MLEAITSWLEAHRTIAVSVVVLSAALAVGSAVALPWVVASLPTDFFASPRALSPPWLERRPAAKWAVWVLRNVVGAVLVVLGIGLLVLPGQGLLAIMVGIAFLQFPGKHRLERWLAHRRRVWRALNWVRRRMGKAEFEGGVRGAGTRRGA